MPEAPVINTVEVATSDLGDESSTSEGSSIEPGGIPGDSSPTSPVRSVPHGAMLLSQLRRR